MSGGPGEQARPVQLRARVVANEPAAAYRRITLAAPGAAEVARPGQFAALAVGDPPTATLLRRSFSLHRAGLDERHGPVLEIVVADAGPGSAWVTRRRVGDEVDVIAPLGKPFPEPLGAGPIVLVGGGYGSAPLAWFAAQLRSRGRACTVVVGAGDEARLFGVEEARAAGADVVVTTDDGSVGVRGRVTDVLPDLLAAGDADVYACGPMPMLRAVHHSAAECGARSWLAVEESMACGVGICMTCVLPVRHADGVTRMTRTCIDGPTFAGEDVRWEAIGAGHGAGSSVPSDALGAPVPGGH
ncbi:MAG: dihydroorotate dehydrogenase electron transfer subunit [Kineosporiaceae bacterium]